MAFTERDNQRYFDSLVTDSEAAINGNFQLYGQTLLGGQGLLRASSKVTRADWHNYVDSLSVEENLPGILAMGYIKYMNTDTMAAEVEKIHLTDDPQFKVHPETPYPDKFVVKYQEPLTLDNRGIIGLDVGYEKCRRDGAVQAWQTGQHTLTCKIDLVQKNGVDASFGMYVPVYYNARAGSNIDVNARKLRGFVYGLFVASEFLADISDISRHQLALQAYDGVTLEADSEIYATPNAVLSDRYKNLKAENIITVAGHEWTLIWRPTTMFIPRTNPNVAKAVLISGVLFSFLIAALFHFLVSTAREVQRQVKIRTRELEEATRAKSDFLARMSHEIRTPMNGILGFVDMVRQTNLTKFQREKLEKADVAGRTLLTIINDILDLTKMEAGKMLLEKSPFSLRHILSICADMVSKDAHTRGLLLSLEIDKDCPEIFIGDQYRIQQVCLNLLGNAVKFTEQGYVKIHARYADQNVIIKVMDSGIGIARDKQATIFDSFAQEDASMTRRFGGTGLGLTICRQLVDAMGGSILLESDKDQGTCFTIVLPLDVGLKEQGQDNVVEPSGECYFILLVEDIPMNQEITRVMLQRYGHRVVLAANGQQAVDAVEKNQFDLVLMDIQMPVMDGVAATREIRTRLEIGGETLPIVALTAHAMPDDIIRFYEAGMDDYILKPVKAQDLIHKIKEVMDDTYMPDVMAAGEEEPKKSYTVGGKDISIFDRAEYGSLEAILGADKCLEIYEQYKLDAGPRIASLTKDDLSPMQQHRHLHTMASMAGNMGFKRMEAECRRLMDRLPSMEKSKIHRELANLANLYAAGCEEFEGVNASSSPQARASNI